MVAWWHVFLWPTVAKPNHGLKIQTRSSAFIWDDLTWTLLKSTWKLFGLPVLRAFWWINYQVISYINIDWQKSVKQIFRDFTVFNYYSSFHLNLKLLQPFTGKFLVPKVIPSTQCPHICRTSEFQLNFLNSEIQVLFISQNCNKDEKRINSISNVIRPPPGVPAHLDLITYFTHLKNLTLAAMQKTGRSRL